MQTHPGPVPAEALPKTQRAVRWYPPRYDVRVEDDVPVPTIEHPDDAIVRISLAGLCGSDLHVYRGHEDVDAPCVCGHEFIGTVVALGTSFGAHADPGRPALYARLRVGDCVLAPFTVSCGECHFCRIGFTCRCVHSALFGTPTLPGGQAQFVRVPYAGGTLFRLGGDSTNGTPSSTVDAEDALERTLAGISASSLLLLGDILPTGVFAALQALQHPKAAAVLYGVAYPGVGPDWAPAAGAGALREEDRVMTLAVVGLGPVGQCAVVGLLDMLATRGQPFRVVAIDPTASRRDKVRAIYATIDAAGRGTGEFAVASIAEGTALVEKWTGGVGCNAVLEVVGKNSALRLAYALVRPFGTISSVGVHQGPQLPFTGREVYDKNVSFEFGRCPVRALFPAALALLVRRQDVFGGVGGPASLVERIVGIGAAAESYAQFDKGLCGKVLFDPWA